MARIVTTSSLLDDAKYGNKSNPVIVMATWVTNSPFRYMYTMLLVKSSPNAMVSPLINARGSELSIKPTLSCTLCTEPSTANTKILAVPAEAMLTLSNTMSPVAIPTDVFPVPIVSNVISKYCIPALCESVPRIPLVIVGDDVGFVAVFAELDRVKGKLTELFAASQVVSPGRVDANIRFMLKMTPGA